MVCGRRGHCLRLSWIVAVIVELLMNVPDHSRIDFTSYAAFKQSLTGVILIKFCKV